jgi:ATP-binding cassette subfamily B protein
MESNIVYSPIPLRQVFAKINYFLFSKNKWKVLALIFVIILSSLTTSIDSILLQKVTDQIEQYSSNYDGNNFAFSLFKFILIYALWWESLNIMWRVYDYLYLKAMPDIKAQVVEELYDYIQHHSQRFFQKNLAGDLASRITEGSRSLEMVFSYTYEKIFRKFFVIIFALVTMYSVHAFIASIFLTWLIFFVSASLYFSKRINLYSIKYSRDKARVAGRIVDSIANISVIRMFTAHKFEKAYIASQVEKSVISNKNMQWFMLKLRYGLGLSCTIMITSIIYYIILLKGQQLITIGQCVLIITLCVAVVEDIWDLTQEFGDVFEEIGAFGQTMSLFEKHAIKDAEHAKDLLIKNPSIEFKKVTFHYQNDNNIFKNKSVKIEPYQKVGLAGFSGSGKTTFTNLITRLFDIESGAIFIDGQDIKNVTQESLRRNISLIPQEPILFHRSVLENIKYGNEHASLEEVMKAAKSAYIHDFITKLPDGYHSICGERGNNLSGGQKQRIIIARAILKNAPILILDEATSSLDSHTENLIQKSLRNLMKGKTILVIAHRLSTLLNMDRILVFDNGYIVEDGTHAELKTNGKLYQQLWDAQKDGSIAELY